MRRRGSPLARTFGFCGLTAFVAGIGSCAIGGSEPTDFGYMFAGMFLLVLSIVFTVIWLVFRRRSSGRVARGFEVILKPPESPRRSD